MKNHKTYTKISAAGAFQENLYNEIFVHGKMLRRRIVKKVTAFPPLAPFRTKVQRNMFSFYVNLPFSETNVKEVTNLSAAVESYKHCIHNHTFNNNKNIFFMKIS